MSTHHGQPARYVECIRCGKAVKRHVCDIRRRRGVYCSRACWHATLSDLSAGCAKFHDDRIRALGQSAS